MAIADYVVLVRSYLDDMGEPALFSNTDIVNALTRATAEGVTNVNAAAADLWRQKAAKFSGLVDVTEAGSSRKFSDLHKNALAMATRYDALGSGADAVTGVVVNRPRTRAIVRPSA